MQFWKSKIQGTFLWILVEIGSVFTEDMSLEFFLCFLLWWPFYVAEQNCILSIFGRGPYKEQSYEDWLKWAQWFRRCHLKFFFFFLFLALAAILCSGLSKFGKGQFKEYSCEIWWEIGLMFERNCWHHMTDIKQSQ